jgi:CBS domain-containing protein
MAQETEEERRRHVMAMRLREVMTPDPISLPATSSAMEAARTVRDADIGNVVVVNDQRIFGIERALPKVSDLIKKKKPSLSHQGGASVPGVGGGAESAPLGRTVGRFSVFVFRGISALDMSVISSFLQGGSMRG